MIRILVGHVLDRLRELPAESVQCCVTSPPYYGLRDYGIEPQVWPDGWRGSLGLESTLDLYLDHMVGICREIHRVLRRDGTFWLNIGDSYAGSWGNQGRRDERGTQRAINGKMLQSFNGYPARQPFRPGNPDKNHGNSNRDGAPSQPGLKPKDLMLVPHRLALRLQDDGWWVRSEIVWAKDAPMPESVTDRPTSAHEKIWLLTKSARYFYDAEAVKEDFADDRQGAAGGKIGRVRNVGGRADGYTTPSGWAPNGHTGRNLRNVWRLPPAPFPEAHFATFPPAIPRRCILAGTKPGDTVLDPFAGAGTTLLAADQLQRNCVGIELNPAYAEMAQTRIADDAPLFAAISQEAAD